MIAADALQAVNRQRAQQTGLGIEVFGGDMLLVWKGRGDVHSFAIFTDR